MFGRRKSPVPASHVPWQPMLLDQAPVATVAGGQPDGDPAFEPVRRNGQRRRKRRPVLRPILRIAGLALAVVTVIGLAVGLSSSFAQEPGPATLLRVGLLVLVALGLLSQLRSLASMVPFRRKPRLSATAAGFTPHLLDGAPLKEIARAFGELPPLEWRRPSRTARFAASGSWFGLATGVVVVLAAALVAIAGNLVRQAVTGELTLLTTGFSAVMAALVGFGLWASVRALIRSVNHPRMRRRKRALQRLLRALLNWLLGRGRKALPANAYAQIGGLCVLAAIAVGAGIVPALAGGGDGTPIAAAGASDLPSTPIATPTPTRTPVPPTATATPTPESGSAITPPPPATGGEGTQTPTSNSGTATSGGGGGSGSGGVVAATSTPRLVATAQPAATPTRTATATWTATPTRTATPTPTRTPTRTPTPTPEPPTPVPPTSTPTPTRTPTPMPTNTPTPTPTATPVPPTPTPTCSLADAFSDCDGDGWSNGVEGTYSSNPSNPNSRPEAWQLNASTNPMVCWDGIDNDLNGFTDQNDLKCQFFTLHWSLRLLFA